MAASVGLGQLVSLTTPKTLYGSQKGKCSIFSKVGHVTVENFALSSSSPLIQVPATVAITNGIGYFTITTTPVAVSTPVTITATDLGTDPLQTSSSTTTILPPILTGLDIGVGIGGPGHFIESNTSGTGYLTLNYPAPTGGLLISLQTGTNPALITAPSSFTVSAGQTVGSFHYFVVPVSSTQSTQASASFNGVTVTNSIVVSAASRYPVGFQSGLYLGGPFSSTPLNTVGGGGPNEYYVWLICQVEPTGNVWVSTYYGDKPDSGSWSILKGFITASSPGGAAQNGVCLLTGAVDNQGNVIPDLKGTLGVNNSKGPDPFEFLTNDVLTTTDNALGFTSLGNGGGAAPYEGALVFIANGLTLKLSALSGTVTGGPGTLSIAFNSSQPVGSFPLLRIL